ncbi:MAG: hypothetical protein KH452_08730 [Clostridiales bacterium]|nr:hypothetical protein [Clostridiales bacterium]
MIALQIADIKSFMKKLLLSESFDRFLLLEGSITTYNTFHIDGSLQRSYYTREEQENLGERTLSFWGEVRPFCLELIRGKRTPLAFRFTFRLSSGNVERLLSQTGIQIPAEQINGLLMNLRYDGHSLQCTTGTSLAVFTMDKKLDHAWDDMVQRYFRQMEIPFETV